MKSRILPGSDFTRTRKSQYSDIIGIRYWLNSMKVGIISDSHIPHAAKFLPPQVFKAFSDVNLILHAGDIYQLSVLNELEEIAPVYAARGNGDYHLPDDPRIKENHVFYIHGRKLGLTHSVEFPEPPWCTLERSMQRDFGGPMDILIGGHTHQAMIENYLGILIINPGSPTLPDGLYRLGTVAILELNGDKPQARIIKLEDVNNY